MNIRKCTKCNLIKYRNDYHKNGKWLAGMCSTCKSKYDKQYNIKNRKRIKLRSKRNRTKMSKYLRKKYVERAKKDRKKKCNWSKNLFRAAKARAKRNGLLFNLTLIIYFCFF